MSSYQKFLALALLGVAMAGGDLRGRKEFREALTPREKEQIERELKKKRAEIMKTRGMKEFTFEGITVLALNEKNAIRKINNIKKQYEIS